MTAWTASPVYGRRVVLGPAQNDVLRVVLNLTAHGRRPELTLARLAVLSGRPVSSVHDALGRLRALGIVGVSARMGRHGGHRLWRVTARSARDLGADAHRRAVARILRRWGVAITKAVSGAPATRPAALASADPPPTVDDDVVTPNGSGSSVARQIDPFGVEPIDWTPPPPGESFRDKLRRYGLGDWIDERDHKR